MRRRLRHLVALLIPEGSGHWNAFFDWVRNALVYAMVFIHPAERPAVLVEGGQPAQHVKASRGCGSPRWRFGLVGRGPRTQARSASEGTRDTSPKRPARGRPAHDLHPPLVRLGCQDVNQHAANRVCHRRLRHDRRASTPAPWPRCPTPGWWRWSAAARPTPAPWPSSSACRARSPPTSTPSWRAPTCRRSSSPRPAGPTSSGRGRGAGRQARRRRETAGDHRRAVRPHHRRLRPSRRPAVYHLPLALRRRQPRPQGRRRGGPLRPADAGRDDVQVVAAAVLLRRGRLERHPGARRRRGR